MQRTLTRTNVSKRALFILAHQDDEYFAIPWIHEELRSGSALFFVYLTNGGARTAAGVRDAESLNALAHLGVPATNVAFLGSRDGIPDGALMKHLPAALASTLRWLEERDLTVQRIYAPDYEGGHADHDAAHVLAAVLARRLGASSDAWAFSLYNAFGCPAPFFRTLRPLLRLGARSTSYSIAEGFHSAVFCRYYPSQRRTWFGLFPESLYRRVFLRRESVNPINVKVISRPHEGALLYERLFGVNYSDFKTAASAFFHSANAAGIGQTPGERTKRSS